MEFGLPSSTAFVYSAILLFSTFVARTVLKADRIEVTCSDTTSAPDTILSVLSFSEPAASKIIHHFAIILSDTAYSRGMLPHRSSAFRLHADLSFPRGTASHSDIFDRAAESVASCPLKWVRLMKISASITARPIFAFSIYSPPLHRNFNIIGSFQDRRRSGSDMQPSSG